MITLVDTHAHLDLPVFDDDREAAIERAIAAGVSAMIAIGFSQERWATTAALVEHYPMIVRTVGLHPNHAEDWTDDFPALLGRETADQRVVAIGEIGLDYYRDHAEPAIQRAVFEEQLRLARRLDAPIVIHQRNAEDDVIALLKQEGPIRGVLHCFSGDREFASRCLELGLYLGVGGVATYKSSDSVRDALAFAPLNRVILETDAPYLAPQGHRGSRNEPAMIVRAAETLASIHGMNLAELAEATTDNAIELFGDSLADAIKAGTRRRACE